VGIVALTMAAPLAHYAALGQVNATGFILWGLSILYFSSSIFYVKAQVGRFLKSKSKAFCERPSMQTLCILYHWGLLILVVSLIGFRMLPGGVFLAFLPIILRGLWSGRGAGGRLDLRRIGLLEVVYSIFFALVIIWALRVETLAL
jgi:hypothetical protein